nr:hypothetical protein CFP56_09461 [Quercus suber]
MTLKPFVLGLCLSATVLADVATGPNPVKTAAPGGVFVGYRNSSNTQSPRDLGFSGKVGMDIKVQTIEQTNLIYVQAIPGCLLLVILPALGSVLKHFVDE